MIGSLVFSVIAIALAIIASYTEYTKRYLVLAFFVVFSFLALRYDYGNDYMVYYQYYDDVQQHSFKEIFESSRLPISWVKELGYTLLNRLVPNFFLLVALLALFSSYIYYKFLYNYAPISLLWFSLFIYLFSPDFILIQSSAIRQSVAICFFVLSIKHLIGRDFTKFALLILIGSFFHKSAIVLLPFYFIINTKRWNDIVLALMFVCYFLIALFGDHLVEGISIIGKLISPYYSDAYIRSDTTNPLSSGLGFIFNSFIFLFVLWSHNNGLYGNPVISKLMIIGFLLSPISIYISMFTRIAVYFNTALIVGLPYAISLQRTRLIRAVLLIILISWYSYLYYSFFKNPVWVEHFTTYKINIIHGL